MLQDKECTKDNVEEVITREVFSQGGVKVLEMLDLQGFLNTDEVQADRKNWQIESKIRACSDAFVRGYRTEGGIYYETVHEGVRMFSKWDIHSIIDNGGLDMILFIELPSASYLVKQVRNWKKCRENMELFRDRGFTVCGSFLRLV